MHDNEKGRSARQIHALNQEIRELRKRLNELDDRKEAAFAKKNAVSKTIKELIAQAKEKRIERNRITDSVKEEKEIRETLNSGIRARIGEITALKSQLSDKSGVRENNPARIKIVIDRLDKKIETEVMSFEKETKLMKQIKELKKQYNEIAAGSAVWAKVNVLSKEVDALKKDADSTHKHIQEKARASQEKHENVIEVSKKINELKEEEKRLREEFTQKKREFGEINAKLKDKLAEFTKLTKTALIPGFQPGVLNHAQFLIKKESAAHTMPAGGGASKIRQDLKEKLRLVQEKVRNREKLTTEDILTLQLEEPKAND